MKKNFYYFILITSFSLSSVFAQINLKLGANIGGQISSLRGFDYDETENNFELVPLVGLNVEISVSPSVSIVTGINFERWKKKLETYYYEPIGNNTHRGTAKEGYDFYNIPLLIRYKLGVKKKFFIDGGGFVNYFNKARPNGFYPIFISFEDYNFGAALGVGTAFKLNDYLDLTLQLRDDFGLSDVNKYEEQISGSIKTNTIRLIATLNFEL